MTSNEDAGTGYKPLKRVSPTPLYYPLDYGCWCVYQLVKRIYT
jgi:inorganic pyrophosphatase